MRSRLERGLDPTIQRPVGMSQEQFDRARAEAAYIIEGGQIGGLAVEGARANGGQTVSVPVDAQGYGFAATRAAMQVSFNGPGSHG